MAMTPEVDAQDRMGMEQRVPSWFAVDGDQAIQRYASGAVSGARRLGTGWATY